MATSTMTVKHRPVRIGLLVKQGELPDLERAASICTLLWGGIHNPIIPISSGANALAEQLLKLFQIDVLFPVSHSEEIDKFLARFPYLQSTRMSTRDLFREDWKTKTSEIAYLDSLNAIEKYWQQEFKHAPAEHQSACKFVSWEEKEPLRELFAVSFGLYPQDLNLKDDFQTGFLMGLRAQEIKIADKDIVYAEIVNSITPLKLTGIDLRGYGGSFRSWEGIYFGNPKNFDDLVTFWNLRAAGNHIEFAPLPDFGRLEGFLKMHLQRLDEQQDRHPNIPDHINFSFDRSFTSRRDELRALTERFPTKKQKAINFCDEFIWNGMNVEPVVFCFNWDQMPVLVENEAGSYNVTVTLPEQKFLVESGRSIGHQELALSIEPLGDFGFPDHTLAPPFRPDLNEFYSRQISFDPWELRSEEEGIGVLITARERSVQLKPIKNLVVIEALLGLANIKIETSPGGRLADRLSEKLGGLEGVRVFKIRGVRNLIGKLNSQSTVTRGEATKTIWNDGQFADHERLYIEPREMPNLSKDETFDFLLKNDFFRAGLELKCGHCGLESWLSLRQIDDTWICEFCGHEDKTSLHIRNRGDWKFRKSGLLAKDNNQEGAIPVLLSLLVFRRIVDRHQALRVTSVNLMDAKSPCEIDFMVFNHRRGNIECAFGEAKSAGGSIDANDIENMKRIADKLCSIGVKPYLAFAKAGDSFTATEIDLFRVLHNEGRQPILLTNKEMEPYHPYFGENDDQDKIPCKYAHSFDEMARNSEFRYLR